MDEGGGWSDGGSSSLKRRKIDPPTAETEAEAEEVIYSAPEEEAPSSLSATTTSTKSSRSSSLSPPPDEEEGDDEDEGVDVDVEVPLRRLVPPPNPDDWSAVIARARSHPREAAESYFDPATPPFVDRDDDPRAASACHRCRPLHAMLLHDPPPPAVEAVLRAHPEAVLDATTFGGTTALRIAAERTPGAGGVGPALPPRLRVLRLLLVAELAMARKGERERRRLRRRGGGTLRGCVPFSLSGRRRRRGTGPRCRIRREFSRLLRSQSDQLDDRAERARQDRRDAAEMVPRRGLPKAEELSPPLSVG